jgi:hypothetical protein
MKPSYAQLLEFYHTVAGLTLNHDSLSDHDHNVDIAVVYPSKLGPALEKVDPEWWRKAGMLRVRKAK